MHAHLPFASKGLMITGGGRVSWLAPKGSQLRDSTGLEPVSPLYTRGIRASGFLPSLILFAVI